MNNEGGSVVSAILFTIGFVTLIAAIVIYLVSDDKTSKKWAEQTKVIVEQNSKLQADWQDAQKDIDDVHEHNQRMADQLKEQEGKLKAIEFMAARQSKFPDTININLIDRRPRPQPKVQPTVPGPNPALNGTGKPTVEQRKVIKKVKKQMKALSQ